MHADKKQLVGKLVGIDKICRTSHEIIVAMTLVNTIYCHTLCCFITSEFQIKDKIQLLSHIHFSQVRK